MENRTQNQSNAPAEAPLLPTETLPPLANPPPDPAAEPRLPLGLTPSRLMAAFAIAAASDLVSAFTTWAPPVAWVVDLATALLLFIVLGWRWLLLPGLIMEAIPGVGVVPVWVLVVAAIALWGSVRPKWN